MDIIHKRLCFGEYSFNPLVTSLTQTSCILVISHIFHVLLKPVGQPGPISQVLAGLVLGPTVLSRFHKIRDFFIQPTSLVYYQFFSHLFEVLSIFLIGLETDLSFMRRNFHVASIIGCAGFVLNTIVGAISSPLFIKLMKVPDKKFRFATVIMMVLANSASPVIIRLVADLKFDNSDVGRLAVTSALVNEMACIILSSLFLGFSSWKWFSYLFLTFLLTVSLIGLNRYMVAWNNKSDKDNKYVNNAYFSVMFSLLLVSSMTIESMGYSRTLACFLFGLTFPRKGKTFRTIVSKLSYLVHNFLLPIYFGYLGFQFNLNSWNSIPTIITIIIMVVLNFGGKLASTLAACNYLKIPLNQGVMFALILSLKGHFDVQLINVEPGSRLWWNPFIHNVLLSTVVVDTIIAGIMVSSIVKWEEKSLAHDQTSLELHDPESELRILGCIYGPKHSSGALGLISALNGSKTAIVTPYLMHLVELPEKRKSKLMYHELAEGDQYRDEEDYGGDDVAEINDAVDTFEINDAVDTFTSETKILINIVKAVSSFATLFEDVCTCAENRCISIVFLPYHKHQRIDGYMEIDKDGIRLTNQKVLRHAPCSVGILVDRAQTGFQQQHGSKSVQHVAVLFFGGPDDREALSCSKWICGHPQVNLTLIRLLQIKEQIPGSNNQEVSLSVSANPAENAVDNTYLVEFYNRYISSGKVNYTEKHVSNGASTVAVLIELREAYSLFIVGRGGRGYLSITNLSDWEESPELGTVGDFIASTEFNTNASILVIQKHQPATEDSYKGYC